MECPAHRCGLMSLTRAAFTRLLRNEWPTLPIPSPKLTSIVFESPIKTMLRQDWLLRDLKVIEDLSSVVLSSDNIGTPWRYQFCEDLVMV